MRTYANSVNETVNIFSRISSPKVDRFTPDHDQND